MIVAACEVNTKNSKDRCLLDYDIPNFTLHPVNLDNDVGRGIALYPHASIDRSVIQVKSEITFEEACMLEVVLTWWGYVAPRLLLQKSNEDCYIC